MAFCVNIYKDLEIHNQVLYVFVARWFENQILVQIISCKNRKENAAQDWISTVVPKVF